MKEKNLIAKKIFVIVGKVFACIGTTLAGAFLMILLIMSVIVNGGSESAKKMFVTTILETGALKFLASWYLDAEEIQTIVDGNMLTEFNEEVNTSLITVVGGTSAASSGASGTRPEAGAMVAESFASGDRVIADDEVDEDGDGIIIKEVRGRTFYGTMMIVKDPSRVSLESYYYKKKVGAPLDVIVSYFGGVAGINGGIYNSGIEAGGRPYGVVVSHGVIQVNRPQEYKGLVFIGLNEDNILVVEDISKLDAEGFKKLVAEKKIRDGCCFQEEASDKNNHFVQLIINGKARELNGGMGSGLNPRTAIGQRANGELLLLVTDGRGANSHLGASASDLIEIMQEFGAVNAANLDGGSSTSMVFNGEYLMESVTFRKPNTSWNLPLAFVVK